MRPLVSSSLALIGRTQRRTNISLTPCFCSCFLVLHEPRSFTKGKSWVAMHTWQASFDIDWRWEGYRLIIGGYAWARNEIT